ncbi:hypothetical protein M011DRAFT_523486 [Sporormia fimetaria CBS 119925]|uniref:P-loop containing nucleoside triphosphate hydrolase protein n=1 Tax=Sporormia fimetaria CBS 119925 TaxID=1340428 RepID=A0A6A6VQN0_9PLEO|nr:hypothetical protein M011DRAFT_523486 [Sporormia fimetaria CBS 119925]
MTTMANIVSSEDFPAYIKEHRNVPRYDQSREERAPHAWWALDKAKIVERLKIIADAVCEVIPEATKGDKELLHMRRTADGLKNIPYGPPVKVALIGPQGAGKSKLINALFGQDGLSLTGDDGKACTSSIIRYAQRGPSSTTDATYIAEIAFMSTKDIEKMCETHARAYFAVQHADEDSEDEDGPKRKSVEQDEADERAKHTAQEVFNTIFQDEDSFARAWSSEKYCTGEFVGHCVLACEKLLNTLERIRDRSGVARLVAEKPKDLLEKIKPFIAKVEDEFSLWALVEKITIRFHNPLLEQNIEIWDLPGWGDTNTDRTRYIEGIKAIVDVEIIAADTIRIASEDVVITNVQAAALNHGLSNVKVVATKIDVIDMVQLFQCSGPRYDELKALIEATEAQINLAGDEDVPAKSDTLDKFRTYLERKLVQREIMDRTQHISKELASKLNGPGPNDVLQSFHVSAVSYMSWLKKEKIMFRDQPALSPHDTGIPGLREYLFSLRADLNLDECARHVFWNVPYYIDKLRRASNNDERDVGFRDLADTFDKLREEFIPKMMVHLKATYTRHLNKALQKMASDFSFYKGQVNTMVEKVWVELKAPGFSKVLKSNGAVKAGNSRAKGLENGCDWNMDLVNIFTPAFKKWDNFQSKALLDFDIRLREGFDTFHLNLMDLMDHSASTVHTAEKAKSRYTLVRQGVQAGLGGLIQKMSTKHGLLLRHAIQDDGRKNGLMASLTDPIFDEVFKALPKVKRNNGKRDIYETPKIRFQKNKLKTIFTDDNYHFADREYSADLRSLSPHLYVVTQEGMEIRSKLQTLLPQLEEIAESMRQDFPDGVTDQLGQYGTQRELDLDPVFDTSSKKRKRKGQEVKIKQETGLKQNRLR